MRLSFASASKYACGVLALFLLLGVANLSLATDCSAYTTCTDCIALTPDCGWCTTAGIAGCIEVSNASLACPGAGAFVNPDSRILSNSTNSTLFTATEFSVSLRLGRPLLLPVSVTPGPIPLDILFVEDLSGSMADDVVTLRALAGNLVAQVRFQLQNDTNFGIYGFLEKSDNPFGVLDECDLVSPFPNRPNRFCANYAGNPWQRLTSNATLFQTTLNTLPNRGNQDWPESASEGMIQGALCNTAGWRAGARRMVLMSTDADLHTAGDGRIQGIYEPRTFNCGDTAFNEEGYPNIMEDYPSISQLRAVFLRENIVPILLIQDTCGTTQFCNIAMYQQVVDLWGFGFVYQLTVDSSNIIQAIIDSYNNVASLINLIPAVDPNGWISDISPAGGYVNAIIGVPYPFVITLIADEPNTLSVMKVACFGFGDVNIVASSVQTCNCTGIVCPSVNNVTCAGAGTCECGQCQCTLPTVKGSDCSCNTLQPCVPPCLNGNCECGKCTCLDGWSGPTCNCSSLPCPNNCNGNGLCVCGQCQCTPPFFGSDCSCSSGTCLNTTNGVCDGPTHGLCDACGVCRCSAGWSGPACNCSSIPCPGLCSGHGTCVCGTCQCDPGWTGAACSCSSQPCPRNPITNVTCSGAGTCDACGKCICPLATGASCNCSTVPCPTDTPGVPCSGNGVCECGRCKCNAPFSELDCSCNPTLSCPTANPPFVCSGRGSCECGECKCDPGFGPAPNATENDCSCSQAPCPDACNGNGTCVCGVCVCNPPFIGASCACDSSFTCPANCSGHGTCDVCGTRKCLCDATVCVAPPPPAASAEGDFVMLRAVDTCTYGYVGPSCNCSLAPCAAGCGGPGGAGGDCVCGECKCAPGWTGPLCDCHTGSSCPQTCIRGTCTRCGQCVCEPGYIGVNCDLCDATVRDCTIPCQSTSCGGCISDAQCGWCEQTGNCSLLVVPFCPSALASNCKKKAESLINRTEFRAGAYALGALLLIFLAIVLIYKIFIWRRDKYLWEMYNKSKGDFLQTSPIYQPENTEMVSPLYEGTSGTTTAATQQSGFF